MKIKKDGKVINLTESDLRKITKQYIKEERDFSYEDDFELPIEDKLDDIFFGKDIHNIFTPSGEFGYLSQEKRLSKQITPIQRKRRIQQVINQLENYISYLKSRVGDEDVFIGNKEYKDVWGDY